MEIVHKAEEAARFMDNVVLKEAVANYRRDLRDMWAAESDPMAREALWFEQMALDNVMVHLQSFVEDGVYERGKKLKRNNLTSL
jgi:hypothetical protein